MKRIKYLLAAVIMAVVLSFGSCTSVFAKNENVLYEESSEAGGTGASREWPLGYNVSSASATSSFSCKQPPVNNAPFYIVYNMTGQAEPVYTSEYYSNITECNNAKNLYNRTLSAYKANAGGSNGGEDRGSYNPSDPNATGYVTVLESCWDRANNSNDGDGIICVLQLVVNIFTIGAGVLGVLGITIAGIQYLTAGDNAAQVTKAKRRLFEIAIGLALFGALYVLLKWLVPGL